MTDVPTIGGGDTAGEFWRDRRVMVTGGTGFLGSHVVAALRARGAQEISVPRRADCDLRERADVRRALAAARPDVVVHLAANVGGIGANQAAPGAFFFDNAVMGIELIEACRLAGVGKVVVAGTVCSYPKSPPLPFREADLWNGYPEETNAPYGIAKKALLTMGQAYREQYGLNVVHLIPVNLYGPGDDFDPASSHVVPALIRRFAEARDVGAPTVTLWGTGSASREFLYVEDAAEAFALAAERYDDAAPVNIGSGQEVRIADLAPLIADLVGYRGDLLWDPTKPDGQPRRQLDTTRAREAFGFAARTPLREGLERTVAWWEANRARTGDGTA